MTHDWLHNHKKPDRPADPTCTWCAGKGFYYFRGAAKMCRCRYDKQATTGGT
jgi:hypothetical protein